MTDRNAEVLAPGRVRTWTVHDPDNGNVIYDDRQAAIDHATNWGADSAPMTVTFAWMYARDLYELPEWEG